eukprot:8169227-Heterocapsa_arctica.AAC.1
MTGYRLATPHTNIEWRKQDRYTFSIGCRYWLQKDGFIKHCYLAQTKEVRGFVIWTLEKCEDKASQQGAGDDRRDGQE